MTKKKIGSGSPTYCPAPFNSITVEATGRLSLCCNAVADYSFPGGHRHIGEVSSLEEHFNGRYMDSVRSAMLAGERLKECRICYKMEEGGAQSQRMSLNQRRPFTSGSPQIKSVDFKLGNKCNLKCKMCWPHNSSELMKEWRQLGWDAEDPMADSGREEYYDGYMQEDYSWPTRPDNVAKLMKVTHLVESMKFTGGEPMLNPQLFRVLQHCVDEGTAGGIELTLITNCTKIHPRYLELARQFKHVETILSIDGVGRTYEYIRHPATWDTVLANARRYSDWYMKRVLKGNVRLQSVVSVFNVHQIPELLTLIHDTLPACLMHNLPINLIDLDRPAFMTWRHAPIDTQERVVAQTHDMQASDSPRLRHMARDLSELLGRPYHAAVSEFSRQRLRQFVTQQDRLRGIHIGDYIPHLVETMRPD
jgi:sulfatase maturation enzyme AslB (radical SAM superfamily)